MLMASLGALCTRGCHELSLLDSASLPPPVQSPYGPRHCPGDQPDLLILLLELTSLALQGKVKPINTVPQNPWVLVLA